MSKDKKVVSLSRAKHENETKNEENSHFEPVYCSFCGRPNTGEAQKILDAFWTKLE